MCADCIIILFCPNLNTLLLYTYQLTKHINFKPYLMPLSYMDEQTQFFIKLLGKRLKAFAAAGGTDDRPKGRGLGPFKRAKQVAANAFSSYHTTWCQKMSFFIHTTAHFIISCKSFILCRYLFMPYISWVYYCASFLLLLYAMPAYRQGSKFTQLNISINRGFNTSLIMRILVETSRYQ